MYTYSECFYTFCGTTQLYQCLKSDITLSDTYSCTVEFCNNTAICLPLVLAIGPEPLNGVIFASLGICTTTAVPVGSHLKATTIVLLARENVWCVLPLLKNKDKRL